MDKDIRLIVTDLDGTYLCEGVASEQNQKAVRLARDQGIKVVACTGRTWAMCDWLIPTLGFDDCCVTSNGASIVDTRTGESLYSMNLEPAWLPPLFEAAMASGKAFDVFCGALIHTYTPRRSWWTVRSEERGKTLPKGHEIKLKHCDTYEQWLEESAQHAQLFRVEVAPGEAYPAVLYEAMARHGMGDNLTMSFVDHWDLCHPQASKGHAIDFLCKHYGIGRENVMALGDSDNDTGMIEYAGIGVAMGGAAQGVKDAADIVAPPCEAHGFAQTIQRYVLRSR